MVLKMKYIYSYFIIRYSIRKTFFIILCLILISASFFKNENKKTNSLRIVQDKDRNRITCIEKIKEDIVSSFKKIIPPGRDGILLDIPYHPNYGDTIIWY